MRRLSSLVSAVAAVAVLLPATSYAQQSFSLHVGWFSPRGLDGRPDNDVLLNNLFNGDYSLAYEINDFRNVTFGAEWLGGIGDHLEAGVGVDAYSKTVHSVYAFLVADDGFEIQQDLRLRIVPLTATIRLLPFGRRAAVQPYVGVGVGAFSWGYSEKGDFVDTFDNTIFPGEFEGSGWSVGPVVLGGARFPVGGWSLGGEVRYQNATGDLPQDEFLGSKIDLTGFNYLGTVTFRF